MFEATGALPFVPGSYSAEVPSIRSVTRVTGELVNIGIFACKYLIFLSNKICTRKIEYVMPEAPKATKKICKQ